MPFLVLGRDGWIRTSECGSQSPMPYHLATPQYNNETMRSGGLALETGARPPEKKKRGGSAGRLGAQAAGER